MSVGAAVCGAKRYSSISSGGCGGRMDSSRSVGCGTRRDSNISVGAAVCGARRYSSISIGATVLDVASEWTAAAVSARRNSSSSVNEAIVSQVYYRGTW